MGVQYVQQRRHDTVWLKHFGICRLTLHSSCGWSYQEHAAYLVSLCSYAIKKKDEIERVAKANR